MRQASSSAFSRLRAEMEAEGKGPLFEALQSLLLSAERAPGEQQRAAAAVGLSLSGLRTALHRLRCRCRALIREEVARTVADPADVEEELHHLCMAWQGKAAPLP